MPESEYINKETEDHPEPDVFSEAL